MQTDTCSQVLESIKQALGYLFDDFSFSITTVKPATSDGRCMIVLSSDQCRFRVIYNRGDLEVAVGPLSAPISWEAIRVGETQWYHLKSALDYVRDNKFPNLGDLRRPVPFMTLEQKIAQVSLNLRPDCWKVVQLFSDKSFVTEQHELDQFLREQSEHVRKQLVEWQSEQRSQLGRQDA